MAKTYDVDRAAISRLENVKRKQCAMEPTQMISVSVGSRFGKWVVLNNDIKRGKGSQAKVQCQCDCGCKRLVDVWTLRTGKSKQCRKCMGAANIKPLKKTRYGQWTVVGNAFTKNGRNARVRVRCDCGTIQTVFTNSLVRGRTTRCRTCAGTTPYASKDERIIATALIAARRRCTVPDDAGYKHYGLRGIRFEFSSIEAGVAHVLSTLGPRPKGTSLVRINNNGNYQQGNLRWAPSWQQRYNSRPRSNEIRPEVVTLVRELRDQGLPLHKIAATLTRRGYNIGAGSISGVLARQRINEIVAAILHDVMRTDRLHLDEAA